MNGQTIITSFNALRLKGKIDYDNQIFSETLFIIPYLQEECQSQSGVQTESTPSVLSLINFLTLIYLAELNLFTINLFWSTKCEKKSMREKCQ